MYSNIYLSLQHAFFPTRCAYCGQLTERDCYCCSDCAGQLRAIQHTCLFCAYEQKDCICTKDKGHLQGICAPFYYESLPRQAVHNLKFYNRSDVAEEMGRRIALKAEQTFPSVQFDCIAAVPMYPARRRARGFNQAALLARVVSRNLCVPLYPDLLTKIFNTQAQHNQSAFVRTGNVIGAFDVPNPEFVDQKSILLIDDVYTTGATLHECARTLKIFGAKAVYGGVFAVAKRSKK